MRIFLLFMGFFLASLAHSQVVDRSKDKAKKKTNDRIDTRVDQGIDKGLNAIEGMFKKKKKGENTSEDATSIESVDASDIMDTYTFQHEVDVKMTETSKSGKSKDPVNYTILFHEDEPYMGTQMNLNDISTTSIIDLDANQIITLTDQPGMKMGMAINFEPEDYMTDSETSEMMPKATGNTKAILSFMCYEYTMNDDDYDYVYWVTEDQSIGWATALAAASKNPAMSNANTFSGMVMVSEMTDEKGKKFTMEVTSIRLDQNTTLSTKGYRFIGFGRR